MTDNNSEKVEQQPGLSMKVVMKTIKVRWPSVKQMSTSDLSQLLHSSSEIMLLDTRPEEEYVVSHIAGALKVCPEASDLSTTLDEINKGKRDGSLKVVCYCSLGYRSASYGNSIISKLKQMDQVRSKDVTVYNLDGGLFKWANEGRSMQDNDGISTIYAHPYNAVWGKLLNSGLRKS